MKMYAVYPNNDKIVGFITEESQKQFLIDSYNTVEFYEFEWTKEEPPMITDFSVVNGQLQY